MLKRVLETEVGVIGLETTAIVFELYSLVHWTRYKSITRVVKKKKSSVIKRLV